MVSKTDVACIKGFKSTLKNKIILNYPKFAAKGIFFLGLKNELETAVVNEPSVFEPLKLYCNLTPLDRNIC